MKFVLVQNHQERSELRKSYLDSLIEPQEFFLEQLIRNAALHKIKQDQKTVGYCIVDHGNTLLEFHLEKPWIVEKEVVFAKAINELRINAAYCKTFDHLLLNLCLQFFNKQNIDGFLFREFINTGSDYISPDIKTRQCTRDDREGILSINDGFFESEEELEQYIKHDNLILFEKGEKIVGCGLYQRVIDGKDDFDIGMLVNPEFRRQGYGSAIIHHMKMLCIRNSYRPICGCGYENTASRKCLENAGFINKYLLIRFENIRNT